MKLDAILKVKADVQGQGEIDGPTYSDSDGIQMLNIPYMAQATSANNEMSLVLT